MRSYPLLKIHTIADPAHVNDVMSELLVTQLTKPIISSRIKGGVRGGGGGWRGGGWGGGEITFSCDVHNFLRHLQ